MSLNIPSQCKACVNFSSEEYLCSIYEQLPGEYGREEVTDCPSFLDKYSKDSDNLNLLLKYTEEENLSELEESVSKVVDNLLNGYETKYKVLIVGIARRKIKSIIKMVDIVDNVLDKLGSSESMENMSSSQAIRLLSELNHSMNNDLTFIMKLVNPDTQFRDLQMWVDARSVVNVSGASAATEMKADEILKLSGASRDKIRDAFDALLHQVTKDEVIDIQNIDSEEGEE